MQSISVQKARDLQAEARQWVEGLFGRSLHEDEEVAVFALPPHSAPPDSVRAEAAVCLDRILDKAAENLSDVPDPEFQQVVDEAMQHVRRRDA
jgi:hypothetical protein